MDELARYKISYTQDTGDPTYAGYVSPTGAWYIQKVTAAGVVTYVRGKSDLATNWAGRAGLVYATYDEVFG